MSRPRSSAPIRKYNRGALSQFCWDSICHMLGLPWPREAVARNADTGSDQLSDALQKASKAVRQFERARKPRTRFQAHRLIVHRLDLVLNPREHDFPAPRLDLECPRGKKYREATDDRSLGYSRDPFKTVVAADAPEIALAVVSYLLRAHAFFFCRPRSERSFNAAKVALNDLFQASQLACRLYYSLPESHFREGSQKRYFDRVKEGPASQPDPSCSPFFIWSALQLVEIQRGNIYRQLDNLEEAARYYRHVRIRFDRIVDRPLRVDADCVIDQNSCQPSRDRWFVTPTLVHAYSERAKVLFDRGHFIESLMGQVRCLAYLVRIGAGWSMSPEQREMLTSVSEGLKLLDVVRRESVWEKGLIVSCFGLPVEPSQPADRVTGLAVLMNEGFLAGLGGPALGAHEKRLASDLYARIGLTLFILRRSFQSSIARSRSLQEQPGIRSKAAFRDELEKFFLVHERLGVGATPMALDGRATIGKLRAPDPDPDAPDEPLERDFARRVRHAFQHEAPVAASQRELDEKGFYTAVIESATRSLPNLATMPRRVKRFMFRSGYKERRIRGDLGRRTVAAALDKPPKRAEGDLGRLRDKLVILRRWQSFNPKIPRPHAEMVRGGGYYLLWQGKGIVIDPGYDFVQNFYDEGFSLGDIDAVVVTHSHPDHDDDLSTLSTLVREWNEYHLHKGREEKRLKLDFFLNESAHLKFASWLKASQAGIGRIIPLPLVTWDLDSQDYRQRSRGRDVSLNLREAYHFDLEVVPAWHDDVIGQTSAVGLKFHLYSAEGKVGVVGYTGDSGAYTLPGGPHAGEDRESIEEKYGECDVLIAHLGDVRLRELFSAMDLRLGSSARTGLCVSELLAQRFCSHGHADKRKLDRETVEGFFDFLVSLRLAPGDALKAQIGSCGGRQVTVAEALTAFGKTGRMPALAEFRIYADVEKRLKEKASPGEGGKVEPRIGREIVARLEEALPPGAEGGVRLKDFQLTYALLGFLCAMSMREWHYEYHLGCSGLYRMQQEQVRRCREEETAGKIFVVGELPEELASYRHHIARLLNRTVGNVDPRRGRRVHSFTGDIGLAIALESEAGALRPKIRCGYCNYNNETALRRDNYHPPEQVLETSLKRLNSALIYLCTAHDHHPEEEVLPHDFLSRPALRGI